MKRTRCKVWSLLLAAALCLAAFPTAAFAADGDAQDSGAIVLGTSGISSPTKETNGQGKQYPIDPHRAPVVLDIFTRYGKGTTMKELVDYLNEAGVTSVRGRKIDLNFVSGILHNRKYIGEYRYREIVKPGGIPAIAPQDLFERVQERMAKNKKAPARHKAEDDYLLTTKLAVLWNLQSLSGWRNRNQ